MIKLKGRLLNLNSIDVCGRKFSKNCKISFPDKIPVLYNFQHNIPPCGFAKIHKDKHGLECEVELSGEIPIENAYVGGYYTNIESHSEFSVTVTPDDIQKEINKKATKFNLKKGENND